MRASSTITTPIRILLANDQPIVRGGLRALLERESDFQIVAEAANAREAAVLAEFKRPAIALIDSKLFSSGGASVARTLLLQSHPPAVICIGSQTDPSYAIEAFRAGARAYIAEDTAATDLPLAVRCVARGEVFLSPIIRERLLDESLDQERLPPSLSVYLNFDKAR